VGRQNTSPYVLRGVAGDKGTFDSILNLKNFIDAVQFPWPAQKLL
jgi:hypothetical protein